MKVFDTFADFERDILEVRNHLGFQDWTVVQVHDFTPEERASVTSIDLNQKSSACLATIAHSTKKTTKLVVILDDVMTTNEVRSRCLESYVADMSGRIVGVEPESMDGFTEYESWQEFRNTWLVRDGKPVIPFIIPLLFDLPTDVEYLEWRKSGKTKISYRRLIVTLYAYKENAFYTMFVKNAQREDIEHYIVLLKAQKEVALAWER